MIAKLIRCNVNQEQQRAFSDSQRGWSALVDCPGFLGQFGGWQQHPHQQRQPRGQQALIIGLWQSSAALNHFMTQQHDVIADNLQQQRHYSHCRVSRFQLADAQSLIWPNQATQLQLETVTDGRLSPPREPLQQPRCPSLGSSFGQPQRLLPLAPTDKALRLRFLSSPTVAVASNTTTDYAASGALSADLGSATIIIDIEPRWDLVPASIDRFIPQGL
ncbi:DUF4937 domain-containing protein [uncultured Ferrimonas sp.]|uniref:DUF4937 domain-containing protein n=1 Tax=uncultured Ferrimonas sp. TaxID=432640 RepID=UPI002602E3CB|nr:DUF4937 domain-containing protein [uncultured Ferrimonas sp.]